MIPNDDSTTLKWQCWSPLYRRWLDVHATTTWGACWGSSTQAAAWLAIGLGYQVRLVATARLLESEAPTDRPRIKLMFNWVGSCPTG